MEKQTIIINNPTRSIESRIETLSSELADLGIHHSAEQLVIKSADEYLLIREFRATKLEEMCRKARKVLSPPLKGVATITPSPSQNDE